MASPTVLLCGFGAFGRQHAQAWRDVAPNSRLLIADPSEAARAAATESGCAVHEVAGDAADLITRADVVDIVSTSHDHYRLARAALDAGKPVIIEKPAVKTVAEAEDLDTQARAGGLPAQVQFVLRAHPLVIKAQKLLSGGAIGRLVAMDAVFTGWKRMRPDATLLENDGVHMLDLMRLFAGSAPESFKVTGDRLLGGPIPETIHARLAYPGGAQGYLRLGIMFGGMQPDPYLTGSLTTKHLALIGDKGSIGFDFNADTMDVTEITYRTSEGGHTPTIGAMRQERVVNVTPVVLLGECFRQFLTAVDGAGEVLCDLGQGAVEMTRLLERGREDLAITARDGS
jgi:predicted dehydrogenase